VKKILIRKSLSKFLKKSAFLCKNGKVRPKTFGTLFLIFVVLIGTVAVNSGNNLVYLTFSTILSFIVLSGFLSFFNLKRIQMEVSSPEIIFAGKDTMVSIKIKNNSGIPKFAILVGFLGEKEAFSYVESSAVRNISTIFPVRGVVKIQDAIVSSVFPFGFFERSRSMRVDSEIIVAPQIKNIRIINGPSLREERETVYPGGEDDFYSAREYKNGEDSRKISWPLSARTNKIIVLEKTKKKGERVKLFLDNSIYNYPDPDKFEADVSKVASVVYVCYKNNYEVSLISKKKFLMSSSFQNYKAIFEFLGTVKLEKHLPFKKPADAISPDKIKYA
jgi:uncharacterized protein (DUF58 family)